MSVFFKYLQQGKPLLWYDILYIKEHEKYVQTTELKREKKDQMSIWLCVKLFLPKIWYCRCN
jgi:hypothetical protein